MSEQTSQAGHKAGPDVCELLRTYVIPDDYQASDPTESDVQPDWLSVDPTDYHWASGFKDPALKLEFRRFAYRDCILTWCALVYSIAAAFASVLDSGRPTKPLWTKIYEIPVALITLISSLVDWHTYIGHRGRETQRSAKKRWILKHIMVLGITLQTSIHLHSTNVCHPASNCYMSDRITFLGALVPTCVIAAARIEALNALALAMIYASFIVISDTWLAPATIGPDPTFSVRDAIATPIVYFTVALIGAAAGFLRYSAAVEQFQTRCALEKSHRLATKLRGQVDSLMASTLPAFVLERHLDSESSGNGALCATDNFDEATVFFSDIAGFTRWSSTRSPQQLVKMLNLLVIQFDTLAREYGLVKIATIGDAYFCVGLTHPAEEQPGFDYSLLEDADADAVAQFALAVQATVAKEARDHAAEWGSVKIRVGLHSGPVQGTVVGRSMQHYEVYGPTVDVASKCEQGGQPGAVCVSEATAIRLRMIPGFHVALGARNNEQDVPEPSPHLVEEEGLGEDDGQQVHELREGTRGTPAVPFGSVGLLKTYLLPQSRREPGKATLWMQNPLVATPEQSPDSSVNSRTSTRSSPQVSLQASERKSGGGSSAGARHHLEQQRATQELRRAMLAKKVRVTQLKRGEDSDAGGEEVIGKKQYGCCLNDFASEPHEAKYVQWRIDRSRTLTLWMRVLHLIFTLMIPICMLIGDESQFTAVGLVFLLLAALMITITIVMAKALDGTQSQCTYIFGGLLQYFANIAVIIGIVSSNAGTMTNEPTYAVIVGLFCSAIGNPMASVLHAGFVGSFSIIASVVFIQMQVLSSVGVFLVIFAISSQIWLLVIFGERMMRQAYVEVAAAETYATRREQDSVDRQVTLGKILPGHAVRRLLAFIDEDSQAQQASFAPVVVTKPEVTKSSTIAMEHPATAIMFLDFSAVGSSRKNDRGATGVVLDGNGTSSPEMIVEESEAEGNVAIVAAEEPDPSDNTSPAWLQAHSIADSVLAQWPESVLTKVKSIGSVLIIAGPFPESANNGEDSSDAMEGLLAESVVALLSFAAKLLDQLAASPDFSDIVACRSGLHIGRTVSTVLGSERLCFDLFGDTLNTTSRLMSDGAVPRAAGSMVATASDEYSKVAESAVTCTSAHASAAAQQDITHVRETVKIPPLPESRVIRSKGVMNVRSVAIAKGQASE